MDYLLIKLIHILSSTIVFGTGIGSAFYMFITNRTRNVNNIYFATKYVVIADWLFTTPTMIIQPISGFWLMSKLGYSLSDKWIFWSIILYFFALICWLSVVYLQIKMRNLAQVAVIKNEDLSAKYWQMDIYWIILGSLALPAFLVIFYLMVFKI